RTGVLEGTSHICPHCQGAGRVRSVESAALALLRALDDAASRQRAHTIEVRAATDVALYLLNEKRTTLGALEAARGVRVRILASSGLTPPEFEINISSDTFADEAPEAEARAPSKRAAAEIVEDVEEEVEDGAEAEEEEDEEQTVRPAILDAESEDGDARRRRRRGRRGGRKRREDGEGEEAPAAAPREARSEAAAPASREDRDGKRRRRRGRGRGGRRTYEVDGGEWLDFVGGDLKHLSPRPERRPAQAEQQTAVEAEVETIEEFVERVEPPAPRAAEPPPAPIEAALEAFDPDPVEEPAPVLAAIATEPAPDYEPDQERRDKFFSRLSRWAKK
ncbi:MAG TPA: hypothetical protein PLK37_13260, partial [Terricaulis sp.]|nr:hypothetical protein [Terricaulis sp.]